MLVLGVTEVVHIELVVPVSHHWLVVIRPTLSVGLRGVLAIGTQNLDVMHADHRRETSVVTIGIAQRLARIVNFLGVQQPLQDSFVSLEDGAVLVQLGDNDLVADILEGYKVFRKVGTKVLQLIAVVVY